MKLKSWQQDSEEYDVSKDQQGQDEIFEDV
jgi:hypothetical protein